MDSIETTETTETIVIKETKEAKETKETIVSADELGCIFVDALLEVISTLSGFTFYGVSPSGESDETEETELKEPGENADFDSMIGVMSLTGGKKNIMVFLSAGDSDMKVLCSYMSGVSQDEVTKDDMCDTLCELVNMTAGNAKLRIGGTDCKFELSLPFAITGGNMSVITKKRVGVFSKVLGNSEISVKLKIIC